MSPGGAVADAIAGGTMPGRLWLYSNYHCNLTCSYCLTESSPQAERRTLGPERMIALTQEAAELGFTGIGVTGGEPFLERHLPETLARLGAILPVVVLTNGTLFSEALLRRLRPLADVPVDMQLSLDSADPALNDAFRGAGNFDRVVRAIPQLREIGLRVRIGTTGDQLAPEELDRLCKLHRGMGIGDEDHVVRPIVRRGRALVQELGIIPEFEQYPAELTVTADGAFWSPVGPTVVGGLVDIDLLLTRSCVPLSRPAEAMLRLVDGRPAGGAETII